MICRSCESSVEFLLDFGEHPIVNNLQAEPGIAPKFSTKVGGCTNCGLVQILDPIDPAEFYTNYANASSVKREPHLEKLIEKLESLLPKSAKIIDVGCNDGKFLSRLRKSGFEDLHGLEPTKNMSTLAVNAGFNVYNCYLSLENSEEIIAATGKFDCVVLRQVLEHIESLSEFGNALSNLLKPNALLVVEVPNVDANFNGPDFSLWEEHVNYFNLESLRQFLARHDFSIEESYDSIFNGVCLTALCRRTDYKIIENSHAQTKVNTFRIWANRFTSLQNAIQKELKTFTDKAIPIALYGVGARSLFFLYSNNLIGKISFAIDDDPAKQGKYLPGTAIKIVSREIGFTQLGENSLVLLGVNGENEKKLLDEIAPLKNCQFKSILPPSEYLLSAFKH